MTCRMRTRSAGFTMIELLFVITIMAVLLVITLPRMTGAGSRTALETTSRDLARLCEYARQSAITSNRVVVIVFEPEERKWWLDLNPEFTDDLKYEQKRRRRGETVNEFEEPRVLPMKVEFKEFLLDGETVDDRQIVASFYPNGSASGLTVLLTNDKERVMTMEIERATGRASAYLGQPMSFTEKLEAAGLDSTAYGGTGMGADAGTKPKDRFYRSAGSEEERVSYYQDAAARIMGQTTRQYDRQLQQEDNPDAGRIHDRGTGR
ncbi:MAG: type fimbrial biosis protein FimU [Candidatus Sumerlaeota bacterium]|nr:type fimbrial biosis protein FimU [Candidatus Sumerlaeota bacterium]